MRARQRRKSLRPSVCTKQRSIAVWGGPEPLPSYFPAQNSETARSGLQYGCRKGRTAGLTGMKPKETVVEGSGEESWKCFGEEERIGVRLFRLLPCGRRCG